MFGYVVRRILGMIVLLFLLTLTVFFLFNLLPVDPARLTCAKACSPAILDANRHRLGYDDPPVVQYTKFVSGIFAGRTFSPESPQPIQCSAPCLGYSFLRHEQVLSLITRALPVTFWLAVGGFIVWIFTGLLAGIYAALRRGRWQDRTIMGIALVGYSLPSFFIGLVLIFLVILQLQWLPYPQWVSPADDPVRFLQTMILPWIMIAVLNAAFYVRLTRNQVLETFSEDYVRTARAKGLPERTVVVKHALRAGLTPIVTAAGLESGVPARRRDHHREHLQPAGTWLAGRLVGRPLRPPADHRHHAHHRLVHHLCELDRRPALRCRRSAGEGRMIGRMTQLVSEQNMPESKTIEDKPFLTVDDLSVAFPTEDGLVHAVDGVSFTLERGKTLAIVGESGSGKSVTAQAVMGLLDRHFANVTGEIWLDGEELLSKKPRAGPGPARWEDGDDLPGSDVQPASLLPHRRPADRGSSRPSQDEPRLLPGAKR